MCEEQYDIIIEEYRSLIKDFFSMLLTNLNKSNLSNNKKDIRIKELNERISIQEMAKVIKE